MATSDTRALTQQDEDKIYHWFIHGGQEHASHEESMAFEEWLQADPKRCIKATSLQQLWQDPELPTALNHFDDVDSTDNSAANKKTYKSSNWISLASAAVILLAVGTFWLTSTDSMQQQFKTPIQETAHATLNDGSAIDINADTQINVTYSADERLIDLSKGEARFSVAKNPNRPFVVKTQQANMQALGTIFNVDKRDDITELTVLEGRVAIYPYDRPDKKIVVTAGQQIRVSRDTRYPIHEIDLNNYQDWQNGVVNADAIRLSELLIELNRYSPSLALKAADANTANLLVSGKFDLHDIVKNINILSALHQLDVQRDGNRVLLTQR